MTAAAEHPTLTLARERGWYTHPVDSPEFEHCQGPRSTSHHPLTCDKRGKHPVGGWKSMASNDPARLSRWVAKGYNLAINTGKSGLLVLDEDTPGEMERLALDAAQDLPDTLRVTSGRGTHWYFEMPTEPLGNVGALRKSGYDIDVRGAGGFVVGPGSIHETGTLYEAIAPDAPAAPLPAWLLAQLRKRKSTGVKTEPATPSKTSQVYWQGRTDYDTSAVNGEIARLVAMAEAATPDGEGYVGQPWDETVLAVSRRLAEFANSDWCPLTHGQAEALIRQYAPTDIGFTAEMVADKVRRARQWVVDERRTVPQPYLARDPAPPSLPHGSSEPGRRLVARNLADVQPEPTDWAWQGVIPLGTMTGIAGTAGIGKSTVVSWLTAAFTKGALDGDLKGEPATVLLAAGEDDTARQLKPRLQVAGADLSRVVEFVPEVRDASGSAFETMLQIGEDLPAIRELVVETGARVLVLDPILSFVDGNPNQQRDVRAALDPVAALARELNIAVVVVLHMNKSHGAAGEKVSGSHVWRDTLRSLIVMTIDQESGRRIATIDKLNYGRAGRSMAFSVEGASLSIKGREIEVAKATFLGDSDTSVQDILDRDQAKRDGRRKVADDTADAIEFVREHGPVALAEIYEHCEAEDRQAQINLIRKLRRAVANGHISNPSKGVYAPPDGSVPLDGSEDY